jgi:transcriptional regulator with XRE-family HTH domain
VLGLSKCPKLTEVFLLKGQELAARHIALREQAGLTQEQEAKMAGVSPTTISGIESGKITRPHLKTLLKIARALGADVGELRESGKVEAPPSPTQPLLNGFEEERRSQEDLGRELGRLEGLWGWKSYLSRRVEWCERVLQKSREATFLNPFLSLDTAIQWAVYVGIESTQLRSALQPEIRSYTDADSEIVGELHALLDRFDAVDDTTNTRVNAMMDEAGLTDEDKKQRLRVIRGSAA